MTKKDSLNFPRPDSHYSNKISNLSINYYHNKYDYSNFRKSLLFFLLLCVWDLQLLSAAPGPFMSFHRPRGYLYQPTHPMYFSTVGSLNSADLWNFNYPNSPHRKLFVPDASLYFRPFKNAENPSPDNGNTEGGTSSRTKIVTPFIGARALSNMEKFFEDLQENLEILRSNNEDNSRDSDIVKDPTTSPLISRFPIKTKEETTPFNNSNDVVKSPRGRERWVNPAASFFRGKHRLYPRGFSLEGRSSRADFK